MADDEISPDDILEQTRSIRVMDMTEQDHLAEDNDRPAAPAENPYSQKLPPDHPDSDTDVDPMEAYDEGDNMLKELPHDADSRESL